MTIEKGSLVHPASIAKPWTDQERTSIRTLRGKDFSYEQIAEFLPGRSPNAIRHEWGRIQGTRAQTIATTYDPETTPPLPIVDMRAVYAAQCKQLHDAIERYQARVRAEVAAREAA